ncbi:MAG: hypothetical protein H7061_11195 [Bdellovibrionaceae bacterium]|nr:hypothetical protein [Bdellovibrio sp.]
MINVVALATLFWALILATVSFMFLGSSATYSCILGSAIMLINLIGIWFFMKLVFLKKSIALVVGAIIFKYLILGMILWNLAKYQWLQPLGFTIGLSSLLLAVVSSVFYKKFFMKRGPHAF